MDFLAPSYHILLQLRHHLRCGRSVSESLNLSRNFEPSDFQKRLQRWIAAKERGATPRTADHFGTPLQQIFIETLNRGLAGEPILQRLDEIEEEMRLTMIDTLGKHLQRLPILLLLPLTALIFPGFMLLILGPLLNELTRSLQ
jgi:hypothetical protein